MMIIDGPFDGKWEKTEWSAGRTIIAHVKPGRDDRHVLVRSVIGGFVAPVTTLFIAPWGGILESGKCYVVVLTPRPSFINVPLWRIAAVLWNTTDGIPMDGLYTYDLGELL